MDFEQPDIHYQRTDIVLSGPERARAAHDYEGPLIMDEGMLKIHNVENKHIITIIITK